MKKILFMIILAAALLGIFFVVSPTGDETVYNETAVKSLKLDGRNIRVGDQFEIEEIPVRLVGLGTTSFTLEHDDRFVSGAGEICSEVDGEISQTAILQGKFIYRNLCELGVGIEFVSFVLEGDGQTLIAETKLYRQGGDLFIDAK